MCPTKDGGPGWINVANLFNETDGYFPTCSCSRVSPTTCGPVLCECLELDADGDILQCMDPFKQLFEGTKYIDGIPGPWSMEECMGDKLVATRYCTMFPCFVDGGSWWECVCNFFDGYCTVTRDARTCAISKCCQAQTDDLGREACIDGDLLKTMVRKTPPFLCLTKKWYQASMNAASILTVKNQLCSVIVIPSALDYA